MIDSTVANSTENVSPNIIFIAWLILTSKLTKGNSKGFERQKHFGVAPDGRREEFDVPAPCFIISRTDVGGESLASPDGGPTTRPSTCIAWRRVTIRPAHVPPVRRFGRDARRYPKSFIRLPRAAFERTVFTRLEVCAGRGVLCCGG